MCPFSAHAGQRGQGEGVGGSPGRGLADGCLAVWVPCPAPPSPCLPRLLPPAADRGQVPAAPAQLTPAPSQSASSTLHCSPLFWGGGGEGNWGLVALQGAASNPGTPNPPCPPLAPGCASPSATLPGACGISVRISLSFLPRAEQLIIYPIIKEETVNEMKTSQKHLLGLLSSPPRAACAGSGSGRGTGAPGGAAAAGGCPPHPAFLTAAPSSSRTPRPPWPSILSLLQPLKKAWLRPDGLGSQMVLGVVPRGCHPKTGSKAHWSGAARCP